MLSAQLPCTKSVWIPQWVCSCRRMYSEVAPQRVVHSCVRCCLGHYEVQYICTKSHHNPTQPPPPAEERTGHTESHAEKPARWMRSTETFGGHAPPQVRQIVQPLSRGRSSRGAMNTHTRHELIFISFHLQANPRRHTHATHQLTCKWPNQ